MHLLQIDEKDEKIRVWLSDGSYRTLDFHPYFYAETGAYRALNEFPNIRSVDPIKKRLFGREIEVLRVEFERDSDARKCWRELENFRTYEGDIPLVRRFIIDRGIEPYSEVEFDDDSIKTVEKGKNDLKLLAFDLETYTKGIINPKKDPIIAISLATSGGTRKVIISKNEKSIIREFAELFEREDPDVVLTYNGDGFDFSYLIERAKQNGVRLPLGRDHSDIQRKRGGPRESFSIAGRDTVDLYRVVERDMPEVKIKTLENVAEFLGIMRVDERTNLENEEMVSLWERGETDRIERYTMDDVVETLEIGKKLLPMQLELCRLIKSFLTECTRMGRGRQVENYLMHKASERGELVPARKYTPGERMYSGGFVMEPEKGIFKNVVVLDFASMYPNIMIAYNISPDTYTKDKDEDTCYLSPSGHAFQREPDGFFRSILGELIGERKKLKGLAKEDPIMDLRQYGVKILTNSFYGYTGWGGARWYKLECAEATSAWGRYTIKEVIRLAGEDGIDVIYSDTDSLFCAERSAGQIEEFARLVNSKFPLELESREQYSQIFFAGKKRYAGLLRDGSIVVRGLEVRRGDWCELAKNLQEKVIEIIFREENIEKARDLVMDAIARVEGEEASMDELTIHKSITKSIKEYETAQAHVLALKKALEGRERIEFSNKISYVVLEGKGRMSGRTKLTSSLGEEDRIDKKYYIENQIIPVALRILGHFGVTKDELRGKKQQSLEKWF